MIGRHIRYSWALIFLTYLGTGCDSSPNESSEPVSPSSKVLFIVSNAHYYGDSDIEAMNHFQEIILPHHEFVTAGYEVDFVSPNGGAIAIGYIHNSDTLTKQYLYDANFMNQLEHTLSPELIDRDTYQAVYYCLLYTSPSPRD